MGKEKKGNKKKVVEKLGKKSFKQTLSQFHKKNEEKEQKHKEKKERMKLEQQQQQQQGQSPNQGNGQKQANNSNKNKQNKNPKNNNNNNNNNRNNQAAHNQQSSSSSSSSSSAPQQPSENTMTNTSSTKLSSLQQQFLKKLEGARFRQINEELYTKRGDFAFREFQRDPSKFEIYHRGYREQAMQWPVNPLDDIINFILRNHKKAVIADMGCGDARLAASVPNKVHSFDLVAANDSVVACDISHVPLPDESVDIVVFCLSLMGTNMTDFIREGARILKTFGIFKIAEVRSRFGDNKGILDFIKFMKRAGFEVKPHDKLSENKMFFEVECQKVTNEVYIDNSIELKPCQYKKR